ncbi:MAG TPA: hypothetical protein VHL31_11560 [Geminicoccus sp.]|uniref:hypothetical protein n=1 Tax=Geminicoccus sp. TaxID=2024832 RepID=UPI002E303EA1|nr:hypothetical protein [Geminicoccus sp.]HEX2526916.1 hypothetical protein [Geminicoccus sp.]
MTTHQGRLPTPMILFGIAFLAIGLALLAAAGADQRQVRRLLGALLRQGSLPPVRGSPQQRRRHSSLYSPRPSRPLHIGYRS